MPDPVSDDPRLPRARPAWPAEATAWIRARLDELGGRHFTGAAARSPDRYRFVTARDPEFRENDEDAVPRGVAQLLELGPLGSWT